MIQDSATQAPEGPEGSDRADGASGPGGAGQAAALRSGRLSEWWRRSTWVDAVLLLMRLGLTVLIVAGVVLSLLQNTYSAANWASFLVFGLTLGGIYALVGLGYTMVYGVLRMINFAHGDVFTAGCFGAYLVAVFVPGAESVAGLLLLIAVGGATSALIAVIVERYAYRPFRGSRALAPLICAIGVSFILQYSIRGLFGTGSRAYPDIPWLDLRLRFGIFEVPTVQLFVIAAALATMCGLHILVNHTRFGTAMRAISEDADTATLMGIDVNRVITLTFLIGGAMAGIGGVLYAMVFKQIHAFMGFTLGIKGFAAAVLGGIGNIPGAMVGGLVIGVLESFGPAALLSGFGIPAPYQLKDAIAFGVLVMILIFRPQGLFGERLAGKRM